MPKQHPMTLAELKQFVDYDPATGRLTWIVKPNRRMRAGDEAGAIKSTHVSTGEKKQYRYFSLNGWTTPAARVAWLFTTGEWPERNILFKDGDTLNLRPGNLMLGDFTTTYVANPETGLRQKKMTKEAGRHYGLMRYYGLTGEEYGAMLAAQGGVCDICHQPEKRLDKQGVPVALHVDHDHATNAVRALLCYKCNSALGSMEDDPARLRAAADYIERHRKGDNVVPLKPEGVA